MNKEDKICINIIVFSFDLKQVLSNPSFKIWKLSDNTSGHTIAILGNIFKVLLIILSLLELLRSFNIFSISSFETSGINLFTIILWTFINSNFFSGVFLAWTKLSKYCLRHKLISNLAFSSCSPKLLIKALIIFSLTGTSKS